MTIKFSDFLESLGTDWTDKVSTEGSDIHTVSFQYSLEMLKRYHRWLMPQLDAQIQAQIAQQTEQKL